MVVLAQGKDQAKAGICFISPKRLDELKEAKRKLSVVKKAKLSEEPEDWIEREQVEEAKAVIMDCVRDWDGRDAYMREDPYLMSNDTVVFNSTDGSVIVLVGIDTEDIPGSGSEGKTLSDALSYALSYGEWITIQQLEEFLEAERELARESLYLSGLTCCWGEPLWE